MTPIIHPRQTQGIKILTALFLFFFIPLTAKPQTKVFPEKDAIWCIKTDYQPKMLLYGLTGDTVINEKQYSKLYLLNDTTLNIDEGDRYVGAIRTEGKNVWMSPEHWTGVNKNNEVLLYDFAKNKEEQIKGIKFSVKVQPVPVFHINEDDFFISVLDVMNDNFGRKHYQLEGSIGQDEWIEGIGSLKGLFFYSLIIPTSGSMGDYSPELVSLKQGDSIVYHNKEVCDQPFCWFGVGVEDAQQTPSITLYPNPVKETLHIDLGDIPLPVRFDLFDPQGRIIYTRTLTNSHSIFTPAPYCKGLCHYRLTGSDGKALKNDHLLIE